MSRVEDYAALAPELDRLLRLGGLTNGLPDRAALEAEIAAGTLDRVTLGAGLGLLRQRTGFARLSFAGCEGRDLAAWVPNGPTVTELPHRIRDSAMGALARDLEDAGWKPLLRRVRLSRRAAAPDTLSHLDADGGAARNGRPCDEFAVPFHPEPVSVTAAAPGQAAAILELLNQCFSPLTGCLPTEAELRAELAAGQVLVVDAGASGGPEAASGSAPAGVLRFWDKGRQSELRQLAVAPEARGRGLGRALAEAFLALRGDRLCRVWTAADNLPALGLYEALGFAPDGWVSEVLGREIQ